MSERAYTDEEAERHFWMESDDPMAGRKLNATLVGHKLLRLRDELAEAQRCNAELGVSNVELRSKVERMERVVEAARAEVCGAGRAHEWCRLREPGDEPGRCAVCLAVAALNEAEGK